MADMIHIDVKGDRQVGLRFETFPDALYDELRQEITALANELFGRVAAATPELTGKLRSQERLRIFADPNRITGYVDIAGGKGSNDYAKAGALEYGSKGKPTKVSAHHMRLDHHWSIMLAAPETVMVTKLGEDYSRTPNIEEFAFERGPLEAMQPEILARLSAVVEKAAAEANA